MHALIYLFELIKNINVRTYVCQHIDGWSFVKTSSRIAKAVVSCESNSSQLDNRVPFIHLNEKSLVSAHEYRSSNTKKRDNK